MVVVNECSTNRRPRKRRDADPQEHKRDPNTSLRIIISREVPNGRIVQPLHGAREEAVEARNNRDSRMAGSADPDEQEDGCEEDAGDDGVDVAEEAV